MVWWAVTSSRTIGGPGHGTRPHCHRAITTLAIGAAIVCVVALWCHPVRARRTSTQPGLHPAVTMAHSTYTAASLAASLVHEGIVLELDPITHVSVAFHGTDVPTGAAMTREGTAHAPHVTFTGAESKHYTALCIDPDAPSPSDPRMRNWLHWMVINIPGGTGNVAAGHTVVPYAGPSPPMGVHRYVTVLYEQTAGTMEVHKPAERGRFDAVAFQRVHGLAGVGVHSFTVAAPAK